MSRPTLAVALTIALVGLSGVPAAHAGRVVRIAGGGWGHGMGMSQYGAYGRALSGKSDHQILTHYYTGAHIRKAAMPSRIRVGLLQGQSSIGVSSIALNASGGRGVFKIKGRRKRLAKGGPNVSWSVEPSATGGMHLYKNGVRIRQKGNAVFGDPAHPLLFIYQKYGSMVHVVDKGLNYKYGRMEFGTYSSSSCAAGFCLRLVDSQPMQRYLYGLGEVPSSWPRAALQSQAIAGRTYAYQKVKASGQHRYPCDCAVYDSTLDQAYIGDAKRTGSGKYWKDWKGAVESTDGQVLLHKAQPIDALYMSSSGGYTENNENVWGGTPVSYLRGVRDRADAVAANPNHSWKVTMPWSEFATKLRSSYNVGTVDKFKLVPPFGVSGRVTVVKPGVGGGARIVGTRGVVRASGWGIKAALGLKDTLFRVKVSYTVARQFAARFKRLHGDPGRAIGRVYAVPKGSKHPKGTAQNFTHGRMTWNAAHKKVVWQRGPILRRYDQMGRERSSLGMPISDVWDGHSYRMARYANGSIYWSTKTGAQGVRGPFLTAYRTYGGPTGPLSLPTGPRKQGKNLPHGGVRQSFKSGALYLGPGGPQVFALWGPVQARYRKLGEARSACRYPTSSMKPVHNGLVATFQKGTIRVSGHGRLFVNCGS
ncbi:MAG TPA: SpoIID/LytB domain-containing protein [Actinomycetota bacterium]|nr:SpoIID/LytB domain-containing protein [Actinomycetota bacterium]